MMFEDFESQIVRYLIEVFGPKTGLTDADKWRDIYRQMKADAPPEFRELTIKHPYFVEQMMSRGRAAMIAELDAGLWPNGPGVVANNWLCW